MSRRSRLDADLVRRNLASSRQEALDLISAGRVLVNGAPADKGSRQVDVSDNVLVSGEPARFVSRGGEKLQAALDHFAVEVAGILALDVGASTGGFTDCLLQNGAARVVALDVGHGQLHPRIRSEPRVTVIERTNIRSFVGDGVFDLVVADVSFISLTLVVPALLSACRPGGQIVALIKPQFEAGRRDVSRGKGIITDPTVQEEACRAVSAAFLAAGAVVSGIIPSPLIGGHGNKEFLLHAVARERLPL